jgi:hypothetical protein
MEEFVPYILVLVALYPNQPGQMEIERAELAYPSIEACEADGREIAAHRELYVDERGGTKVTFQCIKSASGNETDIAWQERLKELEAERAERDKKEQQ